MLFSIRRASQSYYIARSPDVQVAFSRKLWGPIIRNQYSHSNCRNNYSRKNLSDLLNSRKRFILAILERFDQVLIICFCRQLSNFSYHPSGIAGCSRLDKKLFSTNGIILSIYLSGVSWKQKGRGKRVVSSWLGGINGSDKRGLRNVRGWFVGNCFQQIGTLDEPIDISNFPEGMSLRDMSKLQNFILINFFMSALIYTIIANIARLSFFIININIY